MIPEEIRLEARKELARRDFWEFEKILYPKLFRDDRWLLKDVAYTIQDFAKDDNKHFLVIALPPAHFKSFKTKNLVLWLLGDDPRTRVISASNAGDLSSTFSTQIRDTIQGVNVGEEGVPYPEIFPDTKIAPGFAEKAKWQLAGASEPTYRSTSPESTITGSRADWFIFDDIIRNSKDALNPRVLEGHWNWFRDTIFTRTDGDNYKFVFVMQRWAKGDLAGRVIDFYGDAVTVVEYPVETDGKILDETIISREKLEVTRKTLSPEIFSANYMQEPLDIKGRLINDIQEYDSLPEEAFEVPTRAFIDTADTGVDYYAGMAYKWHDGKVYIIDAIHTQDPAEVTEPETAEMLTMNEVNEATFESNNGGRLFARNIERIMQQDLNNYRTVVNWQAQTSNKEARILTASAWIQQNIIFPKGWKHRWPEMATYIFAYVKGGKGQVDDALDCLSSIYEACTTEEKVEYWGVR